MKIALLTTDSREHYKQCDRRDPYFAAAPEALLAGFAQLPELEVHVISCLQQPAASPEKIAPNIWYHGLWVPKMGWLRTGYQGCIRAVRRKVQQVKPAIVHGQGTERDCAISAVCSGAPNVITIHGNMAELARLFRARWMSYDWFAARFENFALRRTAGVFCNSEYTERLVKARAARTWRVPNPIREEFFGPSVSQCRSDRPILLNVGVISPRKRQLQLLELSRQLHGEGVPVHMQFIGYASSQEPYANDFLQQMQVAAAQGYASFSGLLPPQQLLRCYDEAHALVHFPSEEAFGLVAAEALARNLRLFASGVGGLIDIGAGLADAHLFQVDDWAGLKRALRSWIDRGFPRATGASEIMWSRYSPKTIAAQHHEIYRQVLSSF